MYILRISLCLIIVIILTILKQIHIIQLNSYNLDQQIIWYKKNLGSFLINIVLLISAILVYELKLILIYFVTIICIFGLLIENFPRKQKKKLVFTARIKRLIFVSLILFAIPFIYTFVTMDQNSVRFLVYITALAPLIIFIAYLILLPIENGIRKKFMLEGKKIIDESSNLYVVGITGSFGKTSVKYYLSTILKYKYSVCMTPESFNTAMGATLTIKNDLKNIDDIFICEMGARRVGDIKEICDIVSPDAGILTDVGNMHLDTFKDISNVKKCKFELIDSVYANAKDRKGTFGKFVLVNGDNQLIREGIREYNNSDVNVYTYGVNKDNDFYYDNIKSDENGVSFTFVSCIYKKNFEVRTSLLGNYNIKNLTAAIAFSMILGLDENEITNGIKHIEAVDHRLKLIKQDINNLIIDDAYNANPNGARNAVDALSGFDGYIKIIITPGMVELSDKQASENESFASYAASKVDMAIVVSNTNREALNRGFRTKLDPENIKHFTKVEDAISFARNEVKGKKVILLENDLSDNY